MCDKCAPNHWGHDIVHGCKPCDCSLVGALSSQCDLNTGCCFCRPEFSGDKCTECRLGYWNYPQCIACQCVLSGTDPRSCDTDLETCSCVNHTGQCSCKANVEGVHCDRCKSGTFGLFARNPLGCSSCYCFGLTTQCSEAKGLIRMWVTLRPEQMVLPLVDENLHQSTLSGIAFQPPEIVANIDQVMQILRSEPVYWRLPEQFEGRKLTAYGGKLKYAIYFEAREETGFTTYYPQVIIRGGPPTHTRVIVRHMAAPLIGQLTRHEIELTEHEWEYYGDGQRVRNIVPWEYQDDPTVNKTISQADFTWKHYADDSRPSRVVSREDFLNVLYDVHYILIKATHGNIMRQSRISEISMEVAEGGIVSGMTPQANLIEQCDCPLGYSGLSCESCSPGFYRLPASHGGRITSQSLGACVVCQCHGHSATCDPDTSVCQNCQHNTAGQHCERCALGFYGIVQGSPEDCQPCACPLSISSNNFSPSCVVEGPSDYRCTACPPGYEGQYCERCSPGYTGNPQTPGGSCQECECDQYGSMPVPCDPTTGVCTCKPGFTGWKCAGCEHRYARDGMKCISCDDECTGLLLNDLDRLNQMIMSVNLTGPLPAPYKLLYSFENTTQELKVTAVGGLLKFTVSYDFTKQEEAAQLMIQPDVILEGGGDLRISTPKGRIHLQPSEVHTEEIVLKPESFSLHGTDVPVSRREFMTIFANLKRILIRATYSYGMNAIYRLNGVSIEATDYSSTGRKLASSVELCDCPRGYDGTSCEYCWPQHRRVNGTIFGGICTPCTCFGHAESCDNITGECLDCKHNTGGSYCDRCLPGFYGDPTKGTAEDCQLCACPLNIPSNNFSPTCHFDRSHGLICDECPVGYVGPRCERCAEGYFGQPLIPGGSCQPCQCNNNLDFSVPGSCDSLSGACLICKSGTTGQYCERCADGYFGDALDARNCQPCHCHVNGSISEICDSQTGQCECKPNVIGRQCDMCKPSYFWAPDKRFCIPCGCSALGSMSLQCDMSGRCICKSRFTGKRCEISRRVPKLKESAQSSQQIRVPPRRWGFSSASGCPRGAYQPATLPETFGLQSSRGCVPCNCNSFGSKSFDCDGNGQCYCQPGVTGKKCDRCAHGFYNFEEGGCTRM
ncbi:laminin subunit alpha-2-like [Meleagris gallopavo]|uniref:laminin subunit alpha-2-like n=1 Tax=Meleagris gallopavo TaxID=9103 RepID=UPI000549D164|nr:laminin subunit alpha-2-like [Meleagris gallopavo]